MEIIISLTSQNNFHTKNKKPTRLASGLKTFSLEFAYRNAPRHPDGCHVNRYHQYELASRAFMEPTVYSVSFSNSTISFLKSDRPLPHLPFSIFCLHKNKKPTRLASGLKTFSLEFAYRNAPRHPDGCHVNRYHQYELASRAFMEPTVYSVSFSNSTISFLKSDRPLPHLPFSIFCLQKN